MSRKYSHALVALVAAGVLALGLGQGATAAGPGSPNIIFILTDDQSAEQLSGMPNTNALITAQGVNFTRAYASYPLCCPSRATFLTGRYMHNHGVRGNGQPFGGAKRLQDLGIESQALPNQLKAAQYVTAHVGKYLNGYGGSAACGEGSEPHVPQGWDWWFGKMAATNGACSENNYFQYSLFEKAGPVDPTATEEIYGSADGEYQTDVYRAKALQVLNDELPGSDPLYLSVGFGAPHGPFEPAPRHKFSLSAAPLSVLPGFDEKNIADKPSFLRSRAKNRLTVTEKSNITTRRRRQLEMLVAVDEAVAAIVAEVAAAGELGNTYFIITSDNGFYQGDHRIGSGKYLPYEGAARVPLVISGPGIPAGSSSELVSNADYVPTALEIAGAPSPPVPMDGRSLLSLARNPALRSSRPILLEGDIGPGTGPGQIIPEALRRPARVPRRLRRAAALGLTRLQGVSDLDQEFGPQHQAINGNINVPAFRAIRTNRYLLAIYATGDTELYDMRKDPGQLTSQHKNKRYAKVRRVLYKRLLALAFCQGDSCRVNVGKDPKPLKKKKKKKKKK